MDVYTEVAGYMLKILDEKIVKTDDDIEQEHKNCKYLYTIDNYDKIIDNEGYLYCVSTSNDSFEKLLDVQDKLSKEGKCCVISGSYNNGGAVGVQYERKG